MVGYSKTPLFRKLGLKTEMCCLRVNAPGNYLDLLGTDTPNVHWEPNLRPGADFIHLFTKSEHELRSALPQFLNKMNRDGMIWVSWPKKSSGVSSDITEDTIRAVCIPLGLVDVKVCAVDEVWSGLKLMIRRELR